MLKKLKTDVSLFLTFMKIGAFTFGGGYAMIPLIERELVENKKWLSGGDLLEIVAIAESTPGPVAVNAATFAGKRLGGFFGAVCATLGVVLPSFIIILALSAALRRFEALPAVRFAFRGVRAGVLALILKALFSMYRQCPKGAASYALMGLSFVLTAFLGAPVIAVIIGCGAFGLVRSLTGRRMA